MRREAPRRARADHASGQAPRDQYAREAPVDETAARIIQRGRQAEHRDREQGRADGVEDRHLRGEDQRRHDQEAAADAKEARYGAGGEAEADQRGRVLARQAHVGYAALVAAEQHHRSDDQHQQREEDDQALAVDPLAEARAGERANPAGDGEDDGATPLHCAGARVIDDAHDRVGGDRHSTRADRDVGLGNADDIEQQRHGEDRSAAADQAEQQSDQPA